MKKKLSLLLCALVLALGVTACGELKDSDELAGRKVSSYKEEVQSYMETLGDAYAGDQSHLKNDILSQYNEYFASYNMTVADAAEMYGMDEDAFIEAMLGSVSVDDYVADALSLDPTDEEATSTQLLNEFKDCIKDAGDYQGVEDVTVQKSGKTITTTAIGDFSKRNIKMTFVYSTLDSSTPTAMNAEPVYTLGEIMKKAGLNTVMGILIVFCMLVVMSGVIKCFEVIPKIEKKLKESKEVEEVKPVPAAPVASAKNETDDLQLVAVIAAAIAASTGASTDSFVVRSIKKRF